MSIVGAALLLLLWTMASSSFRRNILVSGSPLADVGKRGLRPPQFITPSSPPSSRHQDIIMRVLRNDICDHVVKLKCNGQACEMMHPDYMFQSWAGRKRRKRPVNYDSR